MVRQSRKSATPQNRSSKNFYKSRPTPIRFSSIEESSSPCAWTTERSNLASLVILGLVIFIQFSLGNQRELSLSGCFDAILRLLISQGLSRLESVRVFQGLRGVTFLELLESCSTVFSGTYLLPFLRRDEIRGFLLRLNYYSFTDLSPLSFNSTQRTRFFPVRFLKALAKILASVLAPRDYLISFSRPNLVLSMQSSQSMEYQGDISIFS